MEKDNEARLTFETYKEQIDTWYRAHNIILEKSELYYDFLSSLLDLIDETYLGSDVLVSDDDIINHLMNKNIEYYQNILKNYLYLIN